MAKLVEHFKEELNRSSTRYFIFDTAGKDDDKDFETYAWDLKRYNLVREGDVFIYRRQQSASEIKGTFYFFGAGKVDKIETISESRVKCFIIKPYVFNDRLLKSDLSSFNWKFKDRNPDSWEHFFNQYGMNLITKDDFINLLIIADEAAKDIEEDSDNGELEVIMYQQLQKGNFGVEDQKGNVKIRGAAQKIFASKVKSNYGYTCALTGITTKEFLVASHIIPWAEDKENRLNPHNGICFSTLVDKAFDQGYISISNTGKVMLSKYVKEDKALFQLLEPYKGKELAVQKIFAPDDRFLEWHRINRYKG